MSLESCDCHVMNGVGYIGGEVGSLTMRTLRLRDRNFSRETGDTDTPSHPHTLIYTYSLTHRAAASRCRAKKKVWVEDMEKKTKETDSLNQALQQEVISLRSEVQQLKSILIAHKDCPLIVHQTVGSTGAHKSKKVKRN